jgi:hypothetical protein
MSHVQFFLLLKYKGANDLGIVFIFTTALFLSGYVLQQQTVRDIRAAIKPQLVRPSGPELYIPPQFRTDEFWDGKEESIVIDNSRIENGVKSSEGSQRHEGGEGQEAGEGVAEEDENMIGATRWQKAAKQEERVKVKEDAQQKPMNRESATGQEEKAKVEEKPMSRAERRKKIKEEILAVGEGESYKGYRRRMW